MNKKDIHQKLEQAFGPLTESNWKQMAQQRQKEASWRKHSQRIALAVLRSLRTQQITQVRLSEMLDVTPQQVNKWLRGKENLTLDTISKLEDVLNLELLQITGKAKYTTVNASASLKRNFTHVYSPAHEPFRAIYETKVIPMKSISPITSKSSLTCYG